MPTLSESDARRLVEVAFELGQPRSARELPFAVVGLVAGLVAAEQVSPNPWSSAVIQPSSGDM